MTKVREIGLFLNTVIYKFCFLRGIFLLSKRGNDMPNEIQYFISQEQDKIEAVYQGQKIGEITFVRIGVDKLIIDYTGVNPEFRKQEIGLSLVRNVADMARSQKRRVIALCPFARAMFNRYSEFDDIRLINAH